MKVKPETGDPIPRPRIVPRRKQNLGDVLQRLGTIAPDDYLAIDRLVRDVLRHAEARHHRYFPNAPVYGPSRAKLPDSNEGGA